MKVFATETSEGPNVFNIQLSVWKLALQEWRAIEEGYKDNACSFNEFFESACVILVLAGTSASQLLGQNTAAATGRVPHVKPMIDQASIPAPLKTTLREFDDVYEDLRHFGEPKHEAVIGIDADNFTKWMTAVQDLWVAVAGVSPDVKKKYFSNTFKVELIQEEE